ncbi:MULTISPECIES: class Ib ribonucleoside-diphosphate reductase assembly flavoprotein NrdI [Dietzia]|jgi:protein involved in ribonucleotide reduction|uniref:class Ib ribonucleoside-diphosphate reductase assembly flavoprotein NrdI n=1 Tax=Dietzia TaxID=37914 RepID=UPI000804F43D|nr:MULTISPECIES: class Ib ribonucleoside-diphosphate reductase assembly flavoprotein NrdI [Dietzia]ODQ97369.1 ribonucleotide reductase assembly protein NrdI [Dietzia alimentaria]HBD21795.1 class Ib ribonucleoside-diphosphate reductase assembly flavoprotein NrdI [Dietzia sp.]MBB0998435.1 class Ib ribonucleoside-diphosphate reductase assembly flavoprotein NrdI [Dietzia maris]MCT1434354.1 class Ib ribonucleoside-diphosphate reductase assembly flavoprotein NrdI [Dietzia maris]MCT1521454.1 class Ib
MAAPIPAEKPVRIVYFSNISENTKRFVDRLGLPALRIPVRRTEPVPTVSDPYVLIVPTYGGSLEITGKNGAAVPRQVVAFLNNAHNRSLCRGVIAGGNTNFGRDFGRSGDVIAEKVGVPYLYRFELMGTHEDVIRVREGLEEFWQHQP